MQSNRATCQSCTRDRVTPCSAAGTGWKWLCRRGPGSTGGQKEPGVYPCSTAVKHVQDFIGKSAARRVRVSGQEWFFPSIQHWWGHIRSTVSGFALHSLRHGHSRAHPEASKMLSGCPTRCRRRFWALGVFSMEKRKQRGILWLFADSWWARHSRGAQRKDEKQQAVVTRRKFQLYIKNNISP